MNILLKNLLLSCLVFITSYGFSQSVFPSKGKLYNDVIVPRIDIKINQDSLEELLSSENIESTHEYPADFIWNDGVNTDTLKNIGFRLRGNTSRLSQKKSFKVKFDHFEDKRFDGVSEINLNGEHNDPSIIRAKLVWDMMRMAEIEAPRSNHVRLYINGEYRGLYINVEHINNDYLKIRNKSSSGQLLKCIYGSDFVYRGNDPSQYRDDVYEPANNKDNVDKNGLIDFTKALDELSTNEDRCDFEKVFDIDRYLKIMALEILVGHWDNPIYNINNTYIYTNDKTGKLEVITYDTDNTFGIDWFDVDWTQRNIYTWAKSNSQRPIYNNILKIPEYKARFGYYIDRYIKEFYNPMFLNPYIDKIRNKISPYVQNDYYASLDYGYDYDDFLKSYNEALGNHVKNGLKEFIQLRSSSAKSQLENISIPPFKSNQAISKTNDVITFSIEIKSNTPAQVFFNFQLDNSDWIKTEIFDNGISPDVKNSDGVFTFQIPKATEKQISYFIELKDQTGKQNRHPYCEFDTELLAYKSEVKLYINEFMADNDIITDDAGEYEDWIELYNDGEEDIDLKDFYMSDDPNNPEKWRMPDFEIPSKSFWVFWADEDKSQGEDHCNFKLSKDGEFIGIFENAARNFTPIDTFHFGSTKKNVSYGKYPDGVGPVIELSKVTQWESNVLINNTPTQAFKSISVAPNPATNETNVSTDFIPEMISILNAQGKLIKNYVSKNNNSIIDLSEMSAGLYFVSIEYKGFHQLKKLIITK